MPSFIKSGLIHILHQYFTHSLYVYAGETIMPPQVLACGPKPCGGNNEGTLNGLKANFETFFYIKSGKIWHLSITKCEAKKVHIQF